VHVTIRETTVENTLIPTARLAIPVREMRIIQQHDNHALAVSGIDARLAAGIGENFVWSTLARAVALCVACQGDWAGVAAQQKVGGLIGRVGGATCVDYLCCYDDTWLVLLFGLERGGDWAFLRAAESSSGAAVTACNRAVMATMPLREVI